MKEIKRVELSSGKIWKVGEEVWRWRAEGQDSGLGDVMGRKAICQDKWRTRSELKRWVQFPNTHFKVLVGHLQTTSRMTWGESSEGRAIFHRHVRGNWIHKREVCTDCGHREQTEQDKLLVFCFSTITLGIMKTIEGTSYFQGGKNAIPGVSHYRIL